MYRKNSKGEILANPQLHIMIEVTRLNGKTTIVARNDKGAPVIISDDTNQFLKELEEVVTDYENTIDNFNVNENGE